MVVLVTILAAVLVVLVVAVLVDTQVLVVPVQLREALRQRLQAEAAVVAEVALAPILRMAPAAAVLVFLDKAQVVLLRRSMLAVKLEAAGRLARQRAARMAAAAAVQE
jgi:hypothetical protein